MNGRTNSAGGALVSDMEIPLDPCTDFVGIRIKDLEYLGKIRLTWTDPKDKYATPEGEAMEDTDQLVSKWSYTQIVRQADRAPVNPSDGVTVCTETTRNQYQTTGFVDTTAESNVTYYYGAYAFNEDGVYSEVISNGVQPVSFSTTLADNTWEEIDQACTLGLAESLWEIGDTKNILVQFSDPSGTRNEEIPTILIAFDHDDLSDGSGKAKLTFGCRGLVGSARFDKDEYDYGYSGKRYDTASIRTETLPSILSTRFMDNNIANIIRPVIKKSNDLRAYDRTALIYQASIRSTVTTSDSLWLFSMGEIGYNPAEINGPLTDGQTYPYFTTQANRHCGVFYGVRTTGEITASNRGYYVYVIYDQVNDANHNMTTESRTTGISIVPGFCIGKVAV